MGDGINAVFLSYASEDLDAANAIGDALRSAGIEVFFDRSELRGGDAWDQKIRTQIRDCELFLPVISKNTQSRAEGYFRLEWRLADQRTHLMGRNRRFLVPVCIDETREADADVPDSFSASQWARLPGGKTSPEFVARIQTLLTPAAEASRPVPAPASPDIGASTVARQRSTAKRNNILMLASIGAALLAGLFLVNRFVPIRQPAASFSPPPHSIAVLPFTNMSGEKDQDYFSDGLTEELLNALARINELQVAARTSAFSFKDKNIDVGTVGRQLNVSSILEGSVRRSGHTIRITAQLINSATGFNLWSETYDRDIDDVLKLQADIANAVAGALKIKLLEDSTAKAELGGTHNSGALDAYLRGLQLTRQAASTSPMDCRVPLAAFDQAIGLDPGYALAFAARSLVRWQCATNSPDWLSLRDSEPKLVRQDAETAIVLAPTLSDGYVALSFLEQGLLNFASADAACSRALALAPGSLTVLSSCSQLAAYLGRTQAAVDGARHAVALDPLDPLSHEALARALFFARRYDEASAAYLSSIAINHSAEAQGLLGINYYAAGNFTTALNTCQLHPENYRSQICLALVYHAMNRLPDAETQFKKLMQFAGDASAYQYAEINAQWGERQAALDWLEKALQLGDPGLAYVKSDPLLDPLHEEPRYKTVLQKLSLN
jgi:TolB-like protein